MTNKTLERLHHLATDRLATLASIDLYNRSAYAAREGLRIARDVLGDVLSGTMQIQHPMPRQALACLKIHGIGEKSHAGVTSMEKSQIIIVDDGQYRWGAECGALMEALDNLGWARSGRRWREPEMGDDTDPAAAYTALCGAVQPATGYGTEDDFDGDDFAGFVFRPDIGRDVWLLDG